MILLYILMIVIICVLLKSFPDLRTSRPPNILGPWSPVTGVAMFGPGSRWFFVKASLWASLGCNEKTNNPTAKSKRCIYLFEAYRYVMYIYICFSWMYRYKRILYCLFLFGIYMWIDLLFGMERHCRCLRYGFLMLYCFMLPAFGFAP